MIDTIKIISNGDQVTLDFSFDTPDHFSYNFEVVDNTGTQILTGNGDDAGTTHFPLGKASDLVGLFLNIFWGETNDNGAGNNFSAKATATQNGKACNNVQVFSGVSTAGVVNDVTKANFTI